MTTTSQRTNYSSLLLNRSENEQVFSKIGSNSIATVVGVTQLFNTEGPSHNKWYYKGAGAVCLVRDAARKSYFVRFISLDGSDICMEQELYKTIILHKTSNQFLAFEAHACLWGLLFCEKSEFHLFENEILSKVRPKHSSKLDKNTSLVLLKGNKKGRQTSKSLGENIPAEKEKKKKSEKHKKKSKASEKPRLEISGPSNFTVVTHVGHDGITGLENMEDSEKWQDLIKFIYGTTAADITQAETSHLVDIVAKNGGIEKYTNAIEKKKQKKQPNAKAKKGGASNAESSSKVAPPKVPTREHVSSAAAPAPPPPPPVGAAPPPPAKLSISGSSNKSSTTPALGTSLQSQIHQGTSLKKVEVTENSSDEDEEGLLGALVNNLAAFRSKVKGSSSEGESVESGEESDDEW